MKLLIAVLLGASPFVLHLAIVWSSGPLTALFLAIIASGLLASMAPGRIPPWAIGLAAIAVGGLALADVGTATRIAGAWPILVYLAIAWAFGSTLLPGRTPLIERIARIVDHGDAMPKELVRYTRFLTWTWTVVPVTMALASVLLARFTSPTVWSLFTNVLSYIALAVLFFGEYPYRRWRYPDTPHTNPFAVAVRLARSVPELFGGQERHSG
ncbi:MAG: hypothetical protein LJE97_16885 [Betaproteobacteria bacterium]|jgi:uncharacterized membrane protein|nr:hypothetical protein [Betaproteobacteria bacterium]